MEFPLLTIVSSSKNDLKKKIKIKNGIFSIYFLYTKIKVIISMCIDKCVK